MYRRNQFSYIVILILFCSSLSFAETKIENPDDPQKNAIALFETGQFEKALPLFKDLISLYPSDQQLNYYFGACMVETKNYGNQTRQALLASASKNTPDKLDYYLGVIFHAQNDFLTALDYYHRFESDAKGKTKKTVNYQELIELAEQGINPFASVAEENKTEPIEQKTEPALDIAEKATEIVPESIIEKKTYVVPVELLDTIIDFQVTPLIKYMKIGQFKNPESQSNFVQSCLKKRELQSLINQTDILRDKYIQADMVEKEKLSNLILSNEQRITTLNREILEDDLKTQQIESKYWENAASEEIEELLSKNKIIADSLTLLQSEKQEIINTTPPDSMIIPTIEKPEPVAVETTPQGVIYKIQIGAFSKEPPDWMNRLYKKLSLIRKISNYKDENGVTVYTVGEMRSYQDAVETQKQVKIEGIKDASIAAYNNGKRISISSARKLNGE